MAIDKTHEFRQTSLTLALLPIMAAVFIAFLIIGLALPVLPLHVHDDLGLGGLVVGLVAGGQFAASVVSRLSSLVSGLAGSRICVVENWRSPSA